MKTLMGAAAVVGWFALAGPASIDPATAASPKAGAIATDVSKATDLSARHRHRHYRPYYYARPYYYRPYPYYIVPRYARAPFPGGFGYRVGPWW